MSVEGLNFDMEAYLLQFLDAITRGTALQYELEYGERPLSDPGNHIGHLYHLEATLHQLTLDVPRIESRAKAF